MPLERIDLDHVDEIKNLIASGDVSLQERKETFRKLTGRDTTLPNDRLIEAIAATDDDDDELFVANVLKHES